MLKQNIKYTDYNDTERDEVFYFNISEAELAKFTTAKGESFKEALQKSVADRSGEDLIRIMDEFIKLAYGKKTDSGAFVKTESVWEDFRYGGAYDVFYLSILQDPQKCLDFIQGILPAKVRDKITEDLGSDLTPESISEAMKKTA